MNEFRSIPSINIIFNHPRIKELISSIGKEKVKKITNDVLANFRDQIRENSTCPTLTEILSEIIKNAPTHKIPLKGVINATGKVLHTNLGRAVLGKKIYHDLKPIILGYSNLEYDLRDNKRGQRDSTVTSLLKNITGAEDAIVVNNNAAAVMMILQCFAKEKEVIVSRGELIEIGGSFRIPDIMQQSGAKMIEVGTTNRTKIGDYEKNISDNTTILFKAHQSNYFIEGFTESVSSLSLATLAKKHNIISVYDIGSGLLSHPKDLHLHDEPNVKMAISNNIDIVCFSGDKLLGGPQAGIIVGKKKYIQALAKHPLKRALRVGKLTLGALKTAIENYQSTASLKENNPTFRLLSQTTDDIEEKALKLQKLFESQGIGSEVVKSVALPGGGTLPQIKLPSLSIQISKNYIERKNTTAELIYRKLQLQKNPIIAVLKKGNIEFNVFALLEHDFLSILQSLQASVC